MPEPSPVLLALSELYEASTAGRHGDGKLDLQPSYEELLKRAGCSEGERRELAERELRRARDAGLLELVPVHRRDPNHFAKVRFSPANEQALFDFIGRKSPAAQRREWAELFLEAQTWDVPDRFRESWSHYCDQRSSSARGWRGMTPFDRGELAQGREWLQVVAQLLGWEGRTQIRWVSSVVCRDSKYLERRRGTLEQILRDATGGSIHSFQKLGIEPVPSEVCFHGPIRLKIGGVLQDFGRFTGASRLSVADVERIEAVESTAVRCLSVENRAPFLSFAAKGSGELFVHTSYPNAATVSLLRKLHSAHPEMEFWHFGDTDPAGFHILADLRKQTGIPFRAFRMIYRPAEGSAILSPREIELVRDLIERMPDERRELEAMLSAGAKGDFEQESLRPPVLTAWPFYEPAEA